jgi:hypothetical protein
VPEPVALWFERCCARDAGERFQSAEELLEALQLAVGSSIVVTSRVLVPGDQRGPSGTIRGHAAPLSPSTRLLGTEDSGRYELPLGDLTSPKTPSRAVLQSDAQASTVTVHEGSTPRRRSGAWWGIALGVAASVAATSYALLPSHSEKEAGKGVAGAPDTPSAALPSVQAPSTALPVDVSMAPAASTADPSHLPIAVEQVVEQADSATAAAASSEAATPPKGVPALSLRTNRPVKPNPGAGPRKRAPRNTDLGF